MTAGDGILVLALLLVPAYLLRLLFSVFEANDARWILWLLGRLREQRWLDYRVETNLVPATLGYPVLYHWLLSRLPERFWVRFGYLSNAGFDLAIGVAVFLGLLHVWPGSAGTDANARALAATALFLFAPCLFPPTARLMAFNGRAFGLVLQFVSTLGLGAYLVEGHALGLVLSGACFIGLVLSSQFGFQAAVATFLGVGLWSRSVAVLLLPIVSLALAWAVPALGAREPLRYFAGLYRWQYRNRHSGTMPTARARWWRDVAIEIFQARRVRYLWRHLLLSAPQFICVIYAPTVVAGLVLFFDDREAAARVFGEPWADFSLSVAVSLVAAAVLTGFQPFSIFGQAERYLENAAPFTAALFAALAFERGPTSGDALAACTLVGLASLTVCLVNAATVAALNGAWLRGGDGLESTSETTLTEWLEAVPHAQRLLTVPMSRGQTLAASLGPDTPIRVLYDWLSLDGEAPLLYMERFLVGLHWTPETLASAFREFACDGVVVFKKEAWAWHEERIQSGTTLLFDGLRDTLVCVHEDEEHALWVRREFAPAQATGTPTA